MDLQEQILFKDIPVFSKIQLGHTLNGSPIVWIKTMDSVFSIAICDNITYQHMFYKHFDKFDLNILLSNVDFSEEEKNILDFFDIGYTKNVKYYPIKDVKVGIPSNEQLNVLFGIQNKIKDGIMSFNSLNNFNVYNITGPHHLMYGTYFVWPIIKINQYAYFTFNQNTKTYCFEKMGTEENFDGDIAAFLGVM